MDRMLQIYDYLLSKEGRILTSYGIEGVDYTVEDGRFAINRTANDASGSQTNIQKKYPSVEIFRSLASWGKELYYQLNDINKTNIGENNIRESLTQMQWLLNNAQETPSYLKINSMSTPALDKLNTVINPLDDVVTVAIGLEDPVQMWGRVIQSYEKLGLITAIAEVNEELEHTK